MTGGGGGVCAWLAAAYLYHNPLDRRLLGRPSAPLVVTQDQLDGGTWPIGRGGFVVVPSGRRGKLVA